MSRVLVLLSSTLCLNVSFASDICIYPSRVFIDLECELPEKTLANVEDSFIALKSDYFTASQLSEEYPISVDLNSDGICEVLVVIKRLKTVFILKDGEYHSAGVLPYSILPWWYGEFVNGFPRIFVPTNGGHNTDLIHAVDVYYFNGEEYTLEFDSQFSLGSFSDLGLKAFKNKDYRRAEKWYLNAYRMTKETGFHEANNLGLTYIRQGRCGDAIDLLTKHLNEKYLSLSEVKSAKFNIALCKP